MKITVTLGEPRAIPSLGYRFTERGSGKSCATAWDTSYCPGIAAPVSNVEVLLHDIGHASVGVHYWLRLCAAV